MDTRWSVNITPVERVARILVGLTGALAGAFLLASAGSARSATRTTGSTSWEPGPHP